MPYSRSCTYGGLRCTYLERKYIRLKPFCVSLLTLTWTLRLAWPFPSGRSRTSSRTRPGSPACPRCRGASGGCATRASAHEQIQVTTHSRQQLSPPKQNRTEQKRSDQNQSEPNRTKPNRKKRIEMRQDKKRRGETAEDRRFGQVRAGCRVSFVVDAEASPPKKETEGIRPQNARSRPIARVLIGRYTPTQIFVAGQKKTMIHTWYCGVHACSTKIVKKIARKT